MSRLEARKGELVVTKVGTLRFIWLLSLLIKQLGLARSEIFVSISIESEYLG